ncbi:MAG TPA: hypothetical protein ENN36_00750 [Candidatus Bathyarchaeota archaeon]|nr:hypothetical protein [Candidatus Bathyarchaeota archaeon]
MNKNLATTLIITMLAASTILAAFPMACAEIHFPPALDPTSGPPGTKVTVSAGAGGAAKFANVSAYWNSLAGEVLNSTLADYTGAYEMVVTIPQAVNGLHWIVVNDGESESEGAQFNVTAGLVVTYYHLGVVMPIGDGDVYVNGTLQTGNIVEFTLGEVANITAVPASGWKFDSWVFGQGGASNPWYLTMTDDMVAWAVFTEVTSFEVIAHNVTVETSTYVVETVSNSTVSEFVFNGTSIRFQVEGTAGTAGFCNVTIPSELMSGEFSIYKDGARLTRDVDYTRTYNGTHYIFDVTYEHSTHIIEITATEVIPEFRLSVFILIMAITSIALTVSTKKLARKTKM